MTTPGSKVCFHCPRRAAGCAVGCPDFAKERAEKMKEYERRKRNAMVHEYVRDEKTKYLRGTYKSKGWKRKR